MENKTNENASILIIIGLIIVLVGTISTYSTLLTVKYLDLKKEYNDHFKTHKECKKF